MKLLSLYAMMASLAWSIVAVGWYRVIEPFTYGEDCAASVEYALNDYYTPEAVIYDYQIVADKAGNKFFIFHAEECIYPPPDFYKEELSLLLYSPDTVDKKQCSPLPQSEAQNIGQVAAALKRFYKLNVTPPAMRVIVYNGQKVSPSSVPAKPHFAALPGTQPSASAQENPQMVLLDGFTNFLDLFDLTTFGMIAQVTVPSTSGPLAVRHAAAGPENEVWTGNPGVGVTVSDLGAGTVLANIATPSIPVASTPIGIGFTNDGSVALEVIAFGSPDSAGNNGALVVFDAVNRTVTSTLLLKDTPAQFLMGPDSLNAYILNSTGTITYYDVLSGTADLTLSTYTPGANDGFESGDAFIHPDGTRIFWLVGAVVEVFDINGHKVINQFNSTLPSMSGSSMRMSQDGSFLYVGNGQGLNVVIDTVFGNILSSSNTGGPTLTFGGLPVN